MYKDFFTNAIKEMNERYETIKSFEFSNNAIFVNNALLKDDIAYFKTQSMDLKKPFCINFLKLYTTRVLALSNANIASITVGAVFKNGENIYNVENKDDFLNKHIGLQENQIAFDTTNLYAWITLDDNYIVDFASGINNDNFVCRKADDIDLKYTPYIVSEFFERSVSTGVFEHIAKFPVNSWFEFAKHQAFAKNLIN